MGIFGFDRAAQQQNAPQQQADTVGSAVVGALDPDMRRRLADGSLRSPHDVAGDDVELLYLVDNPYGIQPAAPSAGHFGPLPMRTTYDKMFYGCGAAYVAGLVGGGIIGLYRGVSTAQSSQFAIVRNSVLNQTTRYGPWAANSLGILALAWASIDSLLAAQRGVSDPTNHVTAAFVAGTAFKSTAGLRPALLSGTVFAAAVASFCGVRSLLADQSHSSFSSSSSSSLSSTSSRAPTPQPPAHGATTA